MNAAECGGFILIQRLIIVFDGFTAFLSNGHSDADRFCTVSLHKPWSWSTGTLRTVSLSFKSMQP